MIPYCCDCHGEASREREPILLQAVGFTCPGCGKHYRLENGVWMPVMFHQFCLAPDKPHVPLNAITEKWRG